MVTVLVQRCGNNKQDSYFGNPAKVILYGVWRYLFSLNISAML